MYLFLQPIALIGYIIALITIYKSSSHDVRKQHLIILNKILWWISLGPFITLLLAIALTNLFLRFITSADLFFPIAIWLYISLFCIIGLAVTLFYKHRHKPIPMKWYQLGIGWYGLNFIVNLAFITLDILIMN